MSERSLSQTRFTRTTRSAFRDGLVSTNGRVAVIGLVAALATLCFAVWLKVETRRQVKLRIPLASAASRLDASIPTALAVLQGFIVTGEERYLERLGEVWEQGVKPALAGLEDTASSAGDEDLVQRVAELGRELRRLEVDQTWLIEVLRAEGSVPARFLLNGEVTRITESIASGTSALLRSRPRGFDPNYLLSLAALQADVMAVRGAAVEFLEEAAPVHRDQLERRLDGLSSRAEALGTSKPRGDGDALDVLESALEEVGPLVAALRRVIGLREQANWNVGLAYRSEVGPRFQRIRDATIELRSAQGQAMVVAARGASFGTTGVVGLALLVGFISASGLYYSIRLEHRMKEIASKAQMLGQYAIEAPLGGGGMGDVYRAKHALLRRPTAIKLLRRGAELNPRAQERFREEVQLTSQLTHPNTIQVFDYGRTPDGVLYYAMELLEGVDLDALVRQRGPLAPSRAVCVLTQICGSLAEAHALGLLHRDLKPSNIMLTQRGGQWDVAKVLDFGLAARMGMDTSGGQGLVGTPSYMAPEIIEHPDAASVRSDLYAVGCIGYFLLTGTSVFPSDDVETTLDRHRHEAPVRPSERLGRALPEALEAVVLGCLEKSPEDRPASAQRLGQLFAASVEEPWTPADAEAWWSDYGEAIQAEARANAAQGETPAG